MNKIGVVDYTKMQFGMIEDGFKVIECHFCQRSGLEIRNRIDHIIQADGTGKGYWVIDECAFINEKWKNWTSSVHTAEELEALAAQYPRRLN